MDYPKCILDNANRVEAQPIGNKVTRNYPKCIPYNANSIVAQLTRLCFCCVLRKNKKHKRYQTQP